MSWTDRFAEEESPEVRQALRNFKASIDAWSGAAMSRPRSVTAGMRHSGWRLAASWALACVVGAGSLAGVVYQRRHQRELARVAAAEAAAQKAAQEKLVAEQQATNETNQDLLATVDSEVSRAVPAAMEPLAQLMDEKQADENGTQQ
jgi:hypothetical protein